MEGKDEEEEKEEEQDEERENREKERRRGKCYSQVKIRSVKEEGGEGGKRKIEIPSGSNCIPKNTTAFILDIRNMLHVWLHSVCM